MKKVIIAVSLLLTMVSGISYADEICGLLQKKTVAPACPTGQACPRYFMIEYTITPPKGSAMVIRTASFETLQDIQSLEGTDVCVEGSPNGGTFEVTAIKAQ